MTLGLKFLLCRKEKRFDLKKKFIQILWIFHCNKYILVRLWIEVFVSKGWTQTETTITIQC